MSISEARDQNKNIAHNLNKIQRTKDVEINENVEFSNLLLSPAVCNGLTHSGFVRPSPIQLKAIPMGKCGFDLILQAKSGTGKTCVFTVLALEMVSVKIPFVQVLILAPTREIAVQIMNVIKIVGRSIEGLKVEKFIGGLHLQHDIKSLKGCHIAVGSPGRVVQLIQNSQLDVSHVRLFVLDEADKLMEESFIKNINYIYSRLPVSKQMVAASATYPDSLDKNLGNYMRCPVHICPETDKLILHGVRQFVYFVETHSDVGAQLTIKTKELIKVLSGVPFKQCLVFSNYQSRAESISNKLTAAGWPSKWIGSSQDQTTRLKTMKILRSFQCRVLLSTDLTARGIDVENIDLIINLDIPKDGATYLHRIGRSGRYGSYGIAITLVRNPVDIAAFETLLGSIGGSTFSVAVLPEKHLTNVWTCDPSRLEQIRGSDYSIFIKENSIEDANVEEKFDDKEKQDVILENVNGKIAVSLDDKPPKTSNVDLFESCEIGGIEKTHEIDKKCVEGKPEYNGSQSAKTLENENSTDSNETCKNGSCVTNINMETVNCEEKRFKLENSASKTTTNEKLSNVHEQNIYNLQNVNGNQFQELCLDNKSYDMLHTVQGIDINASTRSLESRDIDDINNVNEFKTNGDMEENGNITDCFSREQLCSHQEKIDVTTNEIKKLINNLENEQIITNNNNSSGVSDEMNIPHTANIQFESEDRIASDISKDGEGTNNKLYMSVKEKAVEEHGSVKLSERMQKTLTVKIDSDTTEISSSPQSAQNNMPAKASGDSDYAVNDFHSVLDSDKKCDLDTASGHITKNLTIYNSLELLAMAKNQFKLKPKENFKWKSYQEHRKENSSIILPNFPNICEQRIPEEYSEAVRNTSEAEVKLHEARCQNLKDHFKDLSLEETVKYCMENKNINDCNNFAEIESGNSDSNNGAIAESSVLGIVKLEHNETESHPIALLNVPDETNVCNRTLTLEEPVSTLDVKSNDNGTASNILSCNKDDSVSTCIDLRNSVYREKERCLVSGEKLQDEACRARAVVSDNSEKNLVIRNGIVFDTTSKLQDSAASVEKNRNRKKLKNDTGINSVSETVSLSMRRETINVYQDNTQSKGSDGDIYSESESSSLSEEEEEYEKEEYIGEEDEEYIGEEEEEYIGEEEEEYIGEEDEEYIGEEEEEYIGEEEEEYIDAEKEEYIGAEEEAYTSEEEDISDEEEDTSEEEKGVQHRWHSSNLHTLPSVSYNSYQPTNYSEYIPPAPASHENVSSESDSDSSLDAYAEYTKWREEMLKMKYYIQYSEYMRIMSAKGYY